ncbi:MAG: GNAT family N-acetyltransferase [Phormidesmis sp.]
MLFRSKLDRLITLLGIAGFVVAIVFGQQVLPSAAIDLSVSRQEIARQGEAYLQDKASPTVTAADLADYKISQRFGESGMASIYLQRSLGIAETNRLIQAERLPIYSWRIRRFRPSQQEEFNLSLSTRGELIGYRHTIPEAEPGANLNEDDARAIAKRYLQDERGWNLADWELVDASTTQRPARTDSNFNWKRQNLDQAFDIGDAELRLSVGVQGDRIGAYGYWLKVPEAFSRKFGEERSLASSIARMSHMVGFYAPLCVAFLFFIGAIARNTVNWKAGLPPALLVFTISWLAQLNNLPLYKSYYATTQNYTLFWFQELYSSLFSAGETAVTVYFLWMGGQQLAKRVWPTRDMLLPRSPNRLAVFTQSYWRGLMMGGIGMGYVILFYFVALHVFGSWSPISMNYSNLFSTPFPFLSPLRSGILPAISEELQARLIGIALIVWLTRQRWLALAIPGAIWAFAHLGYLSDPIYLRGIELSIKAIFVYGLFFLKFGLLTTIVGHCIYNASLGAGLLLQANDSYLVASGLLVFALLLAPLAPGLWQHWQQGKPANKHASKRANGLDVQPAIAIRPTVPEDDSQVQQLLKKMLEEKGEFELNDAGKAAIAHFADHHRQIDSQTSQFSKQFEIACLLVNNQIKGIAVAELLPEATAMVKAIYIEPTYRRCYYGTQLISALTQRLQQRQSDRIQVDIETANPAIQRFWVNQSWQTTSRRFHYKLN